VGYFNVQAENKPVLNITINDMDHISVNNENPDNSKHMEKTTDETMLMFGQSGEQ
jgi:cupin superfamily acireductone dioxygenase involved in methionine salvage